MFSDLVELPYGLRGKIFRSPMPFSFFDHQHRLFDEFLQQSIGLVVMLLEEGEDELRARCDLRRTYNDAGIDVIHLPTVDFGVSEDLNTYRQGVQEALQRARGGENVVVHCLAGLGRTGTFLACLAREHLHLGGEDALEWVRRFVPGSIQSEEQEQLVLDYIF